MNVVNMILNSYTLVVALSFIGIITAEKRETRKDKILCWVMFTPIIAGALMNLFGR